jgi:hypothetical protein
MFNRTLIALSVMSTLSNSFRGLDSKLLLDKPDFMNFDNRDNFKGNYDLNNFNSNFNSKNNFRTQIYTSGKNKYSRKHN